MESTSQKYVTTVDKIRETIETYGVAIIPKVIDEEECTHMLSGICDYFEHITQSWATPFRRNDQSTWREFYKLLPLHSMLIQHWGVGHTQASWNLRQNPKIVEIFSKLWNTRPEDLLVSFDGLSFNLPPEVTNKGWFNQSWLHTDQSYTRNGFECIQSWVTALDVNENDATLLVLEGSNQYHGEFGRTFGITDREDWYKLTDQELRFYTETKQCRPVRITCGKGDLVLWDSRTIHCGVEAVRGRTQANFRAVIYLCYLPRLGTSDTNIRKKQKAFNELRTTKHHPQKSLLFGKSPRTYGSELPTITPPNSPVLTDLGRRLAGF